MSTTQAARNQRPHPARVVTLPVFNQAAQSSADGFTLYAFVGPVLVEVLSVNVATELLKVVCSGVVPVSVAAVVGVVICVVVSSREKT